MLKLIKQILWNDKFFNPWLFQLCWNFTELHFKWNLVGCIGTSSRPLRNFDKVVLVDFSV